MIGIHLPVDETFRADPLDWLGKHAGEREMNLLLLHCADGVAWGKRAGRAFQFAHDVFSEGLFAPTINAETLIQARLFGPAGEIFVWRSGEGFAARMIVDAEQETPLDFLDPDEIYWLWGTRQAAEKDFTLLFEGMQGFRHAPPVKNVPEKQRVGLKVRHYIVEEETTGWQRIATSRLVDLEIVKEGA